MSDLYKFITFSLDFPVDFHEEILSTTIFSISVEKLEGTEFLIIKSNTKHFYSSSKEKYFNPLKILILFI